MKRSLFLIVSLLISLLFTNCKKDKLEGDMEQLVGEWEWFESKGSCGTKYPNYCYSTPQSEGYTLSLKFIKKGKYEKHKNDERIEKGRITYNLTSGVSLVIVSFQMDFFHNREKEFSAGYLLDEDTLVLTHYPFEYDGVNGFVRK